MRSLPFAFNQVRLHIPITTTNKGRVLVGNEQFQMAAGRSITSILPKRIRFAMTATRRAYTFFWKLRMKRLAAQHFS